MGIEVTGKIYRIDEERRVSEKFTKREFVLEIADNPKYPQLVQFQATGDRCGQLDDLRVGDTVKVDFALRGREWKSPKGEVKFFNSLDAWSVTLDSRSARGPSQRGGRHDDRDPDWVGDRGGAKPRGGGYGAPPDDEPTYCSSDPSRDSPPISRLLRRGAP